MQYAYLLWPHANARYANGIKSALISELDLLLRKAGVSSAVTSETVFGVDTLQFSLDAQDESVLGALSRFSHGFWLVRKEGETLVPVLGQAPAAVGKDLPYILKYKGKTNERFTELLLNTCVIASDFGFDEKLTFLDPMCSKGTALFEALNRGWDAVGVDMDKKDIAECGDYFKRYLEEAKIKHGKKVFSQTIEKQTPVAVTEFSVGGQSLRLACADSALAKKIIPKTPVHLIAADLPYGVQHGPGSNVSFEKMLNAVLPAWKNCLVPGGAAAVSFNTHTLPRDTVRAVMRETGFTVMEGGAWDNMAHWVEQAIVRDIAVCRKEK